jgi:hypothetical protein
MEERLRQPPKRRYLEAKRRIFVSEMNVCTHCSAELKMRPNWHARKKIQTLEGPLFVAGLAKILTLPGNESDISGAGGQVA